MKEVVTEIQINASPIEVWGVLTAGPDWGAWNPFLVRVEGNLVAGAKLHNTLVMSGKKPMTFKPKVLSANPGKELRWLGRVLMPGLFDGEHYFQLHAEQGGTRLVHGEKFSGILIGMLSFDQVRASFEAFNQGLKARVEGAG